MADVFSIDRMQVLHKKYIMISALWLLVSFFLVLIIPTSESTHDLFAVLTTVAYFLSVFYWVKNNNRLFSIYVFFVVYAFFCNCSQQFLHALQVPSEFLTSYYQVDEATMCYALKFQFVCVCALNLGAMLSMRSTPSISSKDQVEWYDNLVPGKSKNDRLLSIIMFICAAGTVYAAYKTAVLRSSMSYHDFMYGGNKDLDVMFYFGYFYSFLAIRFIFKKQYVYTTYIVWFGLVALYMMLGLRTQAIPYISYLIICLPVTHSQFLKRNIGQYGWLWGLCLLSF